MAQARDLTNIKKHKNVADKDFILYQNVSEIPELCLIFLFVTSKYYPEL